MLSVRRDPDGRPCLDNVFCNAVGDGKAAQLQPVGRLDYDTTGLLLFSASGPLTQSLLHPKHEIEKEYVATVTGTVVEDDLRATLAAGVTTGEGLHTSTLLSVEHMPADQVASYLRAIQAELPALYNTTDLKQRGYMNIFDATSLSIVTLTVSEGKHRMVRRILANTGHCVVSLHRSRLGAIRLGDLPAGATRDVTPTELVWAQRQLRRGSQTLTKKAVQSSDVDGEKSPPE